MGKENQPEPGRSPIAMCVQAAQTGSNSLSRRRRNEDGGEHGGGYTEGVEGGKQGIDKILFHYIHVCNSQLKGKLETMKIKAKSL